MAMAMRFSVTVSIAALKKGMFKWMVGERVTRKSACRGWKSVYRGTNKTSSKVRPSFTTFALMQFLPNKKISSIVARASLYVKGKQPLSHFRVGRRKLLSH